MVSAISLPMAQAAECMVIETYTMLNQHDENAILPISMAHHHFYIVHLLIQMYPNIRMLRGKDEGNQNF